MVPELFEVLALVLELGEELKLEPAQVQVVVQELLLGLGLFLVLDKALEQVQDMGHLQFLQLGMVVELEHELVLLLELGLVQELVQVHDEELVLSLEFVQVEEQVLAHILEHVLGQEL